MTAKKIVHLEWEENVPALTTSNNDRQQKRERERKERQDRVLKRKTISFCNPVERC